MALSHRAAFRECGSAIERQAAIGSCHKANYANGLNGNEFSGAVLRGLGWASYRSAGDLPAKALMPGQIFIGVRRVVAAGLTETEKTTLDRSDD